MPIVPPSFWERPEPGSENPPLSKSLVDLAEARLGVTLPREYVELLREQNGGYTRPLAYPAKGTSWHPEFVSLESVFGIGTDPENFGPLDIFCTEYMTVEWGLPHRLVLLTGDGHWWIALDYRRGAEPSVVWIDTECEEDVQIAPSFGAFLDGLQPEADLAA